MDEVLENPLNSRLYNSLLAAFRDRGGVKVANEGEAFVSEIQRDLSSYPPKLREVVLQGGEEYRVCCPVCGDSRHRLYVNHKWGTTDEAGKPHWNHLIHCFNEECDLSEFGPEHLSPYVYNRPCLQPGEAPKVEPLLRTEWPGECVPLTKLPAGHPAVRYVEGRKFDPAELVDLWDVKYCMDCPESPRYTRSMVMGRIIVPIYWNGELVGWQARAINGELPKYYTMPGLKKQRLLYNGQRAAQYSVGVLVEGVTDVWRLGPRGTGLLGKSVSYYQRLLLCDLFRGKGLVNMLDPEALEDIKRVHKHLKPEEFPGKYAVVRLPGGTDPGSSETGFLYEQIKIQSGLEVS